MLKQTVIPHQKNFRSNICQHKIKLFIKQKPCYKIDSLSWRRPDKFSFDLNKQKLLKFNQTENLKISIFYD